MATNVLSMTSIRFRCHHPHPPFTRVSSPEAPFLNGAGDARPGAGRHDARELQKAEFSRPAHRRAAVLNAELAVHGALVGLHSIERDVEPLTDFTPR